MSAVKKKLNPSGNCLRKVMGLSDKTEGSIISESKNDVKMKQKARMFLRRVFTEPTAGRMKDPATGIKMAAIR
jgi:hypothetical protein